MNPIVITKLLSRLRGLKYFPNDEDFMLGLVEMVGEMASNEEQVRWLVRRMLSGLYSEWHGPRELRACFCSKFKPRDGLEVFSGVYREGIPSERPAKQLTAPEQKFLAAGDSVSKDSGMDAAFQVAAMATRLKSARLGGPATAEEIASAPEWLKALCGGG